jgi:hypothetical protein
LKVFESREQRRKFRPKSEELPGDIRGSLIHFTSQKILLMGWAGHAEHDI